MDTYDNLSIQCGHIDILGECITGQPGVYDMNAGYKGIFLLIDNKSPAAESILQKGKRRDNFFWVFLIYYEQISLLMKLNL